MNVLRDLSVLILGLGDSGLAMARWAQRCGAARVVVADSRTAPPQAAALAQDVPSADLRCGGFPVNLLEGIGLVLKSPGLSPLDPALAPLLAAAAARGVPVRGELDLFAQALADLKTARGYAPKVLAITGTNGKTTTTSLTALLCERAGARTAMAGNIGPTLLDTLGAALDREPTAAEVALPVPPGDAPPDDVLPEDTLPEDALPDETAALAALDGATLAEVEASGAAEPATPEAMEQPQAADATDAADLPAGGGPPPHLIPPPPPGPVFTHLPEVWVLELSSFQLEGVQGFLPTAATVLNITQDHLDWHGDMAAYAAAKARVFGDPAQRPAHGLWVLNRDDAAVMALRPTPPEPELGLRGKPLKAQPRWTPPASASFGLDAPRRAGDWGLVTEHGMAWLVRAVALDDAPPRGRRGAAEADASTEVSLQRLMPADALRIRGRHNAANALAALALASATGLPLAPMLHGLREYRGEPHRVEYLGHVGEVEAYDDSKGTNVGATVAALHGLGPEKAPRKLVLILGGEGKGQDFTPLVDAVAAHARAVALIGKDAPALLLTLAELARDGLPVHTHDSLEAATRWCFEQAQPGDAVLLSPACASLDMFRHYAHRAQVFADTVAALAAERGEMSL
jgi:UDP-N-acetylmuramoylalanine--D-glutamate ligase